VADNYISFFHCFINCTDFSEKCTTFADTRPSIVMLKSFFVNNPHCGIEKEVHWSGCLCDVLPLFLAAIATEGRQSVQPIAALFPIGYGETDSSPHALRNVACACH